MDANLVIILDRTILKCQKTMTESAEALLTILHDFADVIRLKAQHTSYEKNTEFETKLKAARHQKIEKKRKLHKLWTDFRSEIEFINEIVAQNCALIIQQQRSHQKLIAKEKVMAGYKITAKRNELLLKQGQIYNIQAINLSAELEKDRQENMTNENKDRNCWNIKKEKLKDTLMEYDAKMFALQEEMENMQRILQCEAEELDYFKRAYIVQENPYNELMKEKEEYLEQQRQQKLYEIRLRIAKRTIVRFIEDHYPAWKKKKLKASKKKGKYKFNLSRQK